MSRDSSHTHLHLHSSPHADLLESFTHPSTAHLAPDEIYQAPQHQPLNPEDEDDVVPDMHAAFGIQRATQQKREVGWRDLGLVELMAGTGLGGNGTGGGVRGSTVGGGGNVGGNTTAGASSGGASGTATGDVLRGRRRVQGTLGGQLRS